MVQDKTSRLNLRVSPAERAYIRQRASQAHVPVAEYIRHRCMIDDGRPVILVDSEQLRDIYRLVRNAAGNLNQAVVLARRHPELEESAVALATAAAGVATASETVSSFLADARQSF